ncbi:MAG: CRISPR-associated helicase Cas3' [Candidatus Brocadiia bacterium]
MAEASAHSSNDSGQAHRLCDHTASVADLAAEMAGKFGGAVLGRLLGLWHDTGKEHPDFQRYLRGELPRGPSHKMAGALLAHQAGLDLLALVIASHHGGLVNPAQLKAKLRETGKEPLWRRIASDHAPQSKPRSHLPEHVRNERDTELFIRMLFSALTDADFLDTEAHFHPERPDLRDRASDLAELWEKLREFQAGLETKGPVNRARNAVYEHALQAAESEPGIFSLTVPTGGGKTRTAMAFALKHAMRHGLDRVIVVIPYTSIIEQNAQVYRGIFGPEAVVEHHYAVPEDRDNGRNRLASENWDAPIVVTTSVQLFDSLHANKPSRCRKLHNIARSVVVLDEVQTLPVRLIEPTLEMMRQLVAHYGVTFVLSTATQPAFRARAGFDGLEGVREIVPDARELFARLARVDYKLPAEDEERTWEEVAAELSDEPQALCVVNTKADALALFRLLPEEGRFHLSTNMCPAHRSNMLDRIKARLRDGETCRLVSTQLIEAGVDVDFPIVWRAFGPLDSIVQAAGRCNREGKREGGRVVVFRPVEGGMPLGAYKRGAEQARVLARRITPESLHDPSLYDEYFSLLYGTSGLDTANVLVKRDRLAFQDTAAAYHLIDSDTTPVAVGYRDAEELIEQARSAERLDRPTWRGLQRYSVNLYPRQFGSAREAGLVAEIRAGLYAWRGKYDAQTGLQLEGYAPDDCIV